MLEFSPDFDAWICYLVVLLWGCLSARSQVYNRLPKSRTVGLWLIPETWFIFGILLFAPTALLWILDRTGALKDTSLFSALLVCLSYPAILAGSVGTLKVPDSLLAILKPFGTFINDRIQRIVDRTAKLDARFETHIVGRMLGDRTIFEEVRKITVGLPGVKERLDADIAKRQSASDWDRRAEAGLLYLYATSSDEKIAPLASAPSLFGSPWVFWVRLWWSSPLNRSRAIVGLVAVLSILGVVGVWQRLDNPETKVDYHVWRLGKQGNSETDLKRTQVALRSYIANTDLLAVVRNSLSRALMGKVLSTERIDLHIQLLLESRFSEPAALPALRALLARNLRVSAIDGRISIQNALLLLAREADPKFAQNASELSKWTPTKGDSVTDLESHIRDWLNYWQQLERTAKTIPAESQKTPD